MTTAAQTGAVPEWTLADRLRKAREHARLKQHELADDIGIARSSVVNYESGRYEPSRPVLLSWALRTGVDYHWLSGTSPNFLYADMAIQTSASIRRPGRSSRAALRLAA